MAATSIYDKVGFMAISNTYVSYAVPSSENFFGGVKV